MTHTPANSNIPPRGGWGKLNSGQVYGILAADIDRALARAINNRAEATLVQAIRELSWGEATRAKKPNGHWPDARPAQINLSELAREIDPDNVDSERRMLRKAKTTLTKDRIIEDREGGLWINTNLHDWTRLSAHDLRHCGPGQVPSTQHCPQQSR